MAIAIVHHFPGGTKEQYEASVKLAHPADGALPPGQVFHAAGAAPDGWMVVAVFDAKENWEKFRDETLVPALQRGGEGTLPGPPEETVIDLYRVQSDGLAAALT